MFKGERSLSNKGIPDRDSAFYQENGMAWHATMSVTQIPFSHGPAKVSSTRVDKPGLNPGRALPFHMAI